MTDSTNAIPQGVWGLEVCRLFGSGVKVVERETSIPQDGESWETVPSRRASSVVVLALHVLKVAKRDEWHDFWLVAKVPFFGEIA